MSAIYADPSVLWQRVMARVVVTGSGCWEFQGAVTSRGYGCVGSGRKGKSITTHRLSVLVRDGALADDMTVDHLCHNSSDCNETGKACRHRRCVNPDHLDVCTTKLNTQRARARWRYCDRGHELSVVADREAGRFFRVCECSSEDCGPLPTWYAEAARYLAASP